MNKRLTEAQVQLRVVAWLRSLQPKPLFCATVGGVDCSSAQRLKMWQTGYEKGIPDMLIYEPRGPYKGMAIEFKSARGWMRPEQNVWLAELQDRGWLATVYRDPDVAIADISKYLSLNKECKTQTPQTNSSSTKSSTLPDEETCPPT